MEAILPRIPLLSRFVKESGWKRCPGHPNGGFRQWRGLLKHVYHVHIKPRPKPEPPLYGPTDVHCPSCGSRDITLLQIGWMAVHNFECRCGFEWEESRRRQF